MLGVAVLSYPLLWWGLRRSLANFPRWDLSRAEVQASGFLAAFAAFSPNRDELLRRQFNNQLGWPFDALSLRRKRRSVNLAEEIVISALLGWLLYVSHTSDEFLKLWSGMLFFGPLGLAAVGWRLFRPPISLWGRLRTGRLILPRYDLCFLWPAAMFALLWGWNDLAADLGASLPLSIAVQVALFAWCTFRASAAWEAFAFTGTHRIPVPPNVTLSSQSFTRA